MKYNDFKEMMIETKEEIRFLQKHTSTEEEIVYLILDYIIYGYFWDYEADRPTCNCDTMSAAVANTIHHLLHPV